MTVPTSSTATELLPCPFCGGEEVTLYADRVSSLGAWVSCRSCGLEAPTETGVTPGMATEYWNRRSVGAAQRESEPVAWRHRHKGAIWWNYTSEKPDGPSIHLFEVEALYPGAALAEPTTVAAGLDSGDARPNRRLDSADRGHIDLAPAQGGPMTRDDAVKKAEQCFQFNVPAQEWFFTPLRLVAALENLGLLKFEEPKSSPEAMLCDILHHEGLRGLAQRAVLDAITSAGLKIVHLSPQVTEGQP